MKAKLILTTFTYRAAFDGFKLNRGSILSRKPASGRLIRRFLADNARKSHLPVGVQSVTVESSTVSPWIHR